MCHLAQDSEQPGVWKLYFEVVHRFVTIFIHQLLRYCFLTLTRHHCFTQILWH